MTDFGADATLQDADGQTALHKAAQRGAPGNAGCYSALEARAGPAARDRWGRTAAEYKEGRKG